MNSFNSVVGHKESSLRSGSLEHGFEKSILARPRKRKYEIKIVDTAIHLFVDVPRRGIYVLDVSG